MHCPQGQMASKQNGRNAAIPDDNRPSWRPQDQPQGYRSWEDDREESWRSSERYGQGQSGYNAGRFADDRALQHQNQNRNQMYPSDYGVEDRQREPYTDDRFTGRGGQGSWEDRGAREHMGYHRGNDGGSRQRMGYQGQPREGYRTWERPEPDWRPEARRGGHRGKGPAGYTRSDDRIRENICEALTDDDHIDASEIEVIVHNAEVTLTGTVDDRDTKRLAEDCVWQISGVKDVQNNLRLRPQGNPSSSGEVTTHELAESKKHRA